MLITRVFMYDNQCREKSFLLRIEEEEEEKKDRATAAEEDVERK